MRCGGDVVATHPRGIRRLDEAPHHQLLLHRANGLNDVFFAAGCRRGWLVLVTLVGGTLSAGSANAYNMVYDRDIDAHMGRTSTALVTGGGDPASGRCLERPHSP